jgi:hypothetical protein
MAYNVDSFSGDKTIVIEDGTIDSTFDIRLIGKNYAGYGEIQNENFLHLLENFAGLTPPPRPINGQIWYDNTAKRIKYYDASVQRWRGTGGIEVGTVPPINPAEGDLWWRTDLDQLFAWEGTGWLLVGPEAIQGFGKTKMVPLVVTDITGDTHAILAAYVDEEIMYVVSKDPEFILDESSKNLLGPGSAITFEIIKPGITLTNTNNEDGITSTQRIFWGTASHAKFADTADLANLALLSLRANNLVGGQLGSVPFQNNLDVTQFVSPNITTTRKILSQTGTGTESNNPEWVILPTVLPIEKVDGSIVPIPLANGTFPVGKRDGTTITVAVQ